MPPKFDPSNPQTAALIDSFAKLGLSSTIATETARNAKSAAALTSLIAECGLDNGTAYDDNQAALFVKIATGAGKVGPEERRFLVEKVVSGDLKSSEQLAAAIKFVETNPASTPINEDEFAKACGVGIEVSAESLPELLQSYIASLPAAPTNWLSLGPLLGGIKNAASDLKWANAVEVKAALEAMFLEMFGSKEAEQKARAEASAAAAKAKKAKASEAKPTKAATTDKASTAVPSTTPSIPTNIFRDGFLSEFHQPGQNPQIKPELKEQHLAATGGKVQTRFPPEPNGFLHIGHVKAIMIDFGYAKYHGGRCYLRYDDTNPEAEEGRYFSSILESVRWLGFEPWKITYSSDNFQKLYEFAVQMIERGKAYVCHCDPEKIREDRGGGRGNPRACEHRERPVADSLAEFDKMKSGAYGEKDACLRMKQDLSNGNTYMWDLICYRVKLAPHHRTGDKWKVYPTYDFAHALCDSIENISHSLCTVEFIQARESYEWLCDALEVYKARQYEFARLNLQGTFLSKRKIAKLVNNGHVTDWDDPRLFTLIALRRRGIPPGALLDFVASLGVSTAPSTILITKFEQSIRQYLENSAPRLMLCLKPIKLVIENVADDYVVTVDKPLHPKVPAMGTVGVSFRKEIYIDADDFRVQDSADYFRLAPGKSVGLFQAPYPVTCTSYSTDDQGNVTEIRCKLENDGTAKKAKAYIHWVSAEDAVKVDEVRYFHQLFKSDNPPADFEADVNKNSLEVFRGAIIERAFYELAKQNVSQARKEAEERTAKAGKLEGTPAAAVVAGGGHDDDVPVATAEQLVGMECIRFQGMRIAYFTVDRESKLACLDGGDPKDDKLILNRIVTLKEDVGKSV